MNQNLTPQIPETFKALTLQIYTDVFNEYYRQIYYYVRKLIGNQEEAEEIASDTLYKLWIRRNGFKNLLKVKAFLYITAKNASLNYLSRLTTEKQNRRHSALFLEQYEESVEVKMVMAEILKQAYIDFKEQTPKRFAILEMAYIEGLSNTEIAQKLGIEVKSVSSQKSKAMADLRDLLGKRGLLSIYVIVTFRYLYNILHHYFPGWFR